MPIEIISNKKVVIYSFAVVNVVKLFYSVAIAQDSMKILVARVVSVLIIILLSWISLKDKRVYTIILSIIIAISGVVTLGISFFVSFEQPVIKNLFLLLGGYWTYGGVKLLFWEKVEQKAL